MKTLKYSQPETGQICLVKIHPRTSITDRPVLRIYSGSTWDTQPENGPVTSVTAFRDDLWKVATQKCAQKYGLYIAATLLILTSLAFGQQRAPIDLSSTGQEAHFSAQSTPQTLPGSIVPVQVYGGGPQLRVTRVIDGDTIVLSNGEKVRILGIDADEPVSGTIRGQRATLHLSLLCKGKAVRLEFQRDKPERDFAGRLLAYVHLAQGDSTGMDLGADLVKHGLVDVYTKKYRCDRAEEYLNLKKD
jgi:endonuclease YncB( thermonuclease family)